MPPRIGVLGRDGRVFVKEGGLGAGWVLENENCQQVALAEDLIGVLGRDGRFFAKEGLHDPWVLQCTEGQQIALAGNRIGVLQRDGRVSVKEGLHAKWVLENENCQQVALAEDLIGVLGRDGRFFAKEGLHDPWVLECTEGQQIALSGNRIGVLQRDGRVSVKEGLHAKWVLENEGCQQVALSMSVVVVPRRAPRTPPGSRPKAPAPPKPQLLVEIRVAPAHPEVNQHFDVFVVVRNVGSVPTGAFAVAYEGYGILPGGARLPLRSGREPMESIQPGERKEVSTGWKAPVAGTYVVDITPDIDKEASVSSKIVVG